jgi:hypothetical protein
LAKKKTAKKAEHRLGEAITPTALGTLVDGLMQDPHAAGKVMTAEQLEESFSVLGIRQWALRWLLDSNGFYLGKTYSFSGKPASCKSQFAHEVGKLFMEAGGIYVLVETENKTSPSTLKAKLGDLYNSGQFFFHQVDPDEMPEDSEIEPWQIAVSFWIDKLKDNDLAHVPTWIVVDSLVGTGSAVANAQIKKDGGAKGRSPAGMVRAGSNTKYLGKITSTIADTGICLAVTNHLKDTTSEIGGKRPSYIPDKGQTGGGSAVDFHCATMLDFARAAAQKGVNEAGREITISVRKGSFGKDFQWLKVPFDVFVEKDENGQALVDEKTQQPVRRIVWQWETAFTMLLERMCLDSKSKIGEMQKILRMDKKLGKYSSKALGLDGLSPGEFGRAVSENREIMSQLQAVNRFNINFYKVVAGYDERNQESED